MPDSSHLELPSTAERPAIKPVRTRRWFGVRLWLALMFAAIGILSGTSVYLFVSESSESAAQERSQSLTAAKTDTLARAVEADLRGVGASNPSRAKLRNAIGSSLAQVRSDSFRAWYFNSDQKLINSPEVEDFNVRDVPGGEGALRSALDGEGVFNADLPGDQIVVSTPTFGGTQTGALLVLADRPPEVASALQSLQEERLTALAVAVVVAALIGFLVASLITSRIKRFADAAERIAEGDLSRPMQASGRDEIGDLGRALDAMRIALAESFEALSSERDRLSAIFVSLEDAVIVLGADGDVRFANPAASDLIRPDGRPIRALLPWVRRATHRGTAESDHVALEDRVVAIGARNLPAEGAVLIVVRDRTEELRRDAAEREFVSNAAHELRNPIAGMSGAIEVLRSGAKDDPEAREHFLERLAADVDRVSRLTKSLLTLARMEAIGEGEGDVVSVKMAISESAATVEAPEGIDLNVEADEDLVAQADPVLLRQVLIGLLTNAYKHTIPPGVVNLRARREDSSVLIEVEDTGAGIPAGERDRVFDRFYRGSGSLEREGFGLGLAIAKRMIDVMGGAISVASEEGKGSTFTIRLPEAVPSPTPVA
jgi:signal transduction histidine kinase/HAMP domain-containing protein